jgi:hypothetical protein
MDILYFKFLIFSSILCSGILILFLIYNIYYNMGFINYIGFDSQFIFFNSSVAFNNINLYFDLNTLSLNFILLICLLYPSILVMMDFDFSIKYYKYFVYML